jgi:hypothetical protein
LLLIEIRVHQLPHLQGTKQFRVRDLEGKHLLTFQIGGRYQTALVYARYRAASECRVAIMADQQNKNHEPCTDMDSASMCHHLAPSMLWLWIALLS